ncbi:MAG TPA: hypothetical protein PKI20_18655 [Verrucomicrobiota bacterium]|nr:hypothetical protein [Verrucomicrobiota bacterium]
MAVLIEGISVVLRAEAVLGKYSGGWQGFMAVVANSTLCADGELIRVGFMAPHDTKNFIEALAAHGIIYLREGQAEDLVVVDQQRGFAAPCIWAEFGQVDWQGDPTKKVSACRAVKSTRTELVTPDGWTYEGSLSSRFVFVEAGRVPEFMDFLRHENGLDVYRDLRTGKEVYVSRPGRGGQG